MNKEPNMEKNLLLAVSLSMIVLLGYSLFVQRQQPKPVSDQAQEGMLSPNLEAVNPEPALKTAEGPFLEKPQTPTIVAFENQHYEVELSTLGGTITRLFYKGESEHHGITKTLFYEVDPAKPGLFGLSLLHEAVNLRGTLFRLNRGGVGKEIFEFVHEKPAEYRLTKRFRFDPDRSVVWLELEIENLTNRERHFPLEFHYGMNYELSHGLTAHNFEAVVANGKLESANLDKLSKKGFMVSRPIPWAGLVKKYFALLVKPDWNAILNEAKAEDGRMEALLRLEPVSVPPQSRMTHAFLIYAGPQRYETLKSFDAGLEQVFSRGFFGVFKIWLLQALKFCYRFVHNYGWAVILLTLFLKGMFTPLTHMSFENMKKMQALQPKLKSLQERYKNDPQKLNREMMELYKRNRVNPMLGCLPMVVQIPIFIAFYQVLNDAIELKGAPFMGWIRDLSEPDRLLAFPTLPIIGDSFNLLPILMIGSMVWQQKLTPQSGMTPEQTQVMNFMPIIFGFLFYKMPSGLVLYWLVNNLLSIAHQIFVKRMAVALHHEDRE